MNNLQDVLAHLDTKVECLIFPHIMPDGDTIGSCLALYRFLIDAGNKAYIVLDDAIPFDLKGYVVEPIYTVENFNKLETRIDTVFCVDFSDIERLGKEREALIGHATTINLDHHITNTMYAKINVVDVKASATGEIIYALIEASGHPIKKSYAEPLYIAISTDTGSFKYSSTTGRTHEIISQLYKTGIEVSEINRTLYSNNPFHKIRLHSDAMNHLELYHNNEYAIIHVSQDMLERCQAVLQDSDGLVETIRDISGVELVIFLKEIEPQMIKVSMRSKQTVDVSALAQRFKGGGHKHAAGFTMNMSLHEALDKIRNLIGDIQ